MATRDELVNVVTERYARSDRAEKPRILDEVVAVSDLHRKDAMRLLRNGQQVQRSRPRRRARFMTMRLGKR